MAPLDRGGATTIYAQIRDRLKGAIADGTLRTHDRLPSERWFGERLGVSRMTVRQALDELIAEGLLHTLPAKGTFVAEHHIEQPLSRLTGFTDDMTARGVRRRAGCSSTRS